MNTAMTLYSKHFHGKSINIGIEDLKTAILTRDDFTSKLLPNGDERVIFSDKSNLIFTYDNVQVSLF